MARTVKHQGRVMLETTAIDMHSGNQPDDMDDCYTILPGQKTLVEVWDYGVMLIDDKVVLYGNFPDTGVPFNHKIYYSPPERYARHFPKKDTTP